MITLDELKDKEQKICVVGLGYVGLPLAILLAKKFAVIGFDIDEEKIAELKAAHDRTGEVDTDTLRTSTIVYSSNGEVIKDAAFIVVAVPTPVDENNIPDMTILKAASGTVGKHIQKGSIVVFESTVYPGATEEICLPIIEKESGLTAGKDFWLGYSPERVNPGDKQHTIDCVTKVVSGMDDASADVIAGVYGSITNIHRAPSIKVAEAAKIIENTQRDLNIALMNELSELFHRMDIDTYDVLAAAGTKWNFLRFEPGLVGGHCIGVDPYYLTYKAKQLGHKPQVMLAGREINDRMHVFIVEEIMRNLLKNGQHLNGQQFMIWGITFKENVPDVRNSKAASLYRELLKHNITAAVYDPIASERDVRHEYGMMLTEKSVLPKADILIVAVKHTAFTALSVDQLLESVNPGALIVDIKHIYPRTEIEKRGYRYWSL